MQGLGSHVLLTHATYSEMLPLLHCRRHCCGALDALTKVLRTMAARLRVQLCYLWALVPKERPEKTVTVG
jgi:hypothetical protein